MNPDRVLESFLEMVAIESPSWHEAPMAAYCAEKLAEMGFTVTFDASAAETGLSLRSITSLSCFPANAKALSHPHIQCPRPRECRTPNA